MKSVPFPFVVLAFAIIGLLGYAVYLMFNKNYSGEFKSNETAQTNPTNQTNEGKPWSEILNINLDPNNKPALDPDNFPTREQINTLFPDDPIKAYQIWIKQYYPRFKKVGTLPKNRFWVNGNTNGSYYWVPATFWGQLHGFPYPSHWWYAETNEGAELRENHLGDRFSKQLALHDIHESKTGSTVWEKNKYYYVTPNGGFSDDKNEFRMLAFA